MRVRMARRRCSCCGQWLSSNPHNFKATFQEGNLRLVCHACCERMVNEHAGRWEIHCPLWPDGCADGYELIYDRVPVPGLLVLSPGDKDGAPEDEIPF